MKRLFLVMVIVCGVFSLLQTTKASAGLETFQDLTSCNSNQSNAELQELQGGAWVDIAPAEWALSPTCTGTNAYYPYAEADLPAGVSIRFHVYPTGGGWDYFSPVTVVTLPVQLGQACSTLSANQVSGTSVYTCLSVHGQQIWTTDAESACKLPYTGPLSDGSSDGFPININRVPSLGTAKILLLFVDFSDDPAGSENISTLAQKYTDNVSTFFKSESFGKFNVAFTVYPKWIRMPVTSSSFNMLAHGTGDYSGFLTTALNAGLTSGVSFGGYSSVFVIPPASTTDIADGPTTKSDAPIVANIPNLFNASTGGDDVWGTGQLPWIWLTHEFGLQMGLEESFGGSQNPVWSVTYEGGQNPNGVPSLPSFNGMGYLGWDKWILGWLNDSQVSCIDASRGVQQTHTYNLTPIESGNTGNKIVTIKLDSTNVLVVEYRTTAGFDKVPSNFQGALVYSVNTSLNSDVTNNTPAYVVLGTKNTPYGQLAGTIQKNQSVNFRGQTIKVLDVTKSGLTVQVRTGTVTPAPVTSNSRCLSSLSPGAELGGGQCDFSNSNLRFENLSNIDVSGDKFVGTDLSSVNFTGANLSRANLTNAILQGANLTGANLSGAVLDGASTANVISDSTTICTNGNHGPCLGALLASS